MPRKKNKRNPKIKQLKIIQARLMEISLQMEKYVYKNRPITMHDAQIYYQEVSSFKNQCGDNARILQVIDKLKHQLKSLMEEGQDSSNRYNVQEIIESSIATCPISPTYSSHNGAPSNDERVNEKDNDITIDGMPETIEAINLFSDENDTIDLCSDIDEIIFTRTENINDASNTFIKDIERSLSNLTVSTENAKQARNVGNVIDNYIIQDVTIRKCASNDKNKIVMDTDIQKQRSVDSVHYDRKQDQLITKVSDVNFKPSNNKATNQNITNSIATTSKLKNKMLDKNVPNKKRRTTQTKQNDTKTKEKPKKRCNKKACKTKDITITTDMIIDNNCIKNVFPPRTVNNNNNLIKPVKVHPHAKSHPINALYNSNVENDLSWIENIRYIREVAPDEIDPNLTYVDDSFWQTLDLPTNWNDKDFSY